MNGSTAKNHSNKGTGGMEYSVVLFKPRIHLFACTLPSVSSSLDCVDWFAKMHQSTSLCPNTWFLAVYKHQSPLCVSNMFGLWLLVCVHASVSILFFKHVWIMVPCLCTHIRFQSCVQNRLVGGCLSVYTHLSTALCFKYVCLLLLLCVQASGLSQKWLRLTWMSSVPCRGNGDGHEHGCSDALTISLPSACRFLPCTAKTTLDRLVLWVLGGR